MVKTSLLGWWYYQLPGYTGYIFRSMKKSLLNIFWGILPWNAIKWAIFKGELLVQIPSIGSVGASGVIGGRFTAVSSRLYKREISDQEPLAPF